MNHPQLHLRLGFFQSLAASALLGLALSAAPLGTLYAQAATEVELEEVLTGMSATVDLKNAGDSRLFAL